MTQKKHLLTLEDVQYSAGRNHEHGPIVILQQKDGASEHPIGSYDPNTKKFKWDDGSLDDARQEELANLVTKQYGK